MLQSLSFNIMDIKIVYNILSVLFSYIYIIGESLVF